MSDTTRTIKVEITPKTIITVFIVVFGIYLLYTIRNIVMLTFISFILASAASAPVTMLIEKKVPKWLAVTLVYFFGIVFIVSLMTIIAVPLVRETTRLVNNLPQLSEDISRSINEMAYGVGLNDPVIQVDNSQGAYSQVRKYLSENLGSLLSSSAEGVLSIANVLVKLVGGIIAVVTMLTVSVYMITDHDFIVKSLTNNIADRERRKQTRKLILEIEHKLGDWLRGQAIVGLTTGIMSWIALSLLHIPYALPLAVFSAVMTCIPTIGATLSAIPPILLSLAGGNIIQILLVPVAYILIQQVENNITAPRIMGNAVGVRPLIIILALLTGAELAGFAGALIAVPIAALVQLVWEFWIDIRDDEAMN